MVSVALLRGLLIFCAGCSIGVLISFWNYGVNTIVTWRRAFGGFMVAAGRCDDRRQACDSECSMSSRSVDATVR
jgi:hypothetical protein